MSLRRSLILSRVAVRTLFETASLLVVARFTLDLFYELATIESSAKSSQHDKRSDQTASD
jgi:hypothetical protein